MLLDKQILQMVEDCFNTVAEQFDKEYGKDITKIHIKEVKRHLYKGLTELNDYLSKKRID